MSAPERTGTAVRPSSDEAEARPAGRPPTSGWRETVKLTFATVGAILAVVTAGQLLGPRTEQAREPDRPALGTVKPGPLTTGVPAGTRLKRSGPLVVTRPGAVIDRLDVDGPIDVQADRVTIRRCRIRGNAYWGVRIFEGHKGTRIEDSEIAPTTPDPNVDAIRAEAGFVGRRLNIHGTTDGVKAASGTRLEASWIHDLATAPDAHSDAVQVLTGADITLVGNTLEGATNAAVMVSTDLGPISRLVIERNWVGGGAYTLNVRGGPNGRPTGVRIIGNRFARDAQYGPAIIDGPVEQHGNVWAADGRPLVL
jgi:hypothetical protein